MLILVAGLRSQNVGIDLHHHYVRNYYTYGHMPWSNISSFGIESGLFVLSKILNSFSLDVQWFIFITSFLSLLPVLVYLYKESKDFKVSIILFITYCLYYQHFNQIQQQIAVSFVLIGILFLNKKRNFMYVFCTLLGATFHSTALLSFAFLLIKKVKVNLKTLIYLFLGIIVALYGFNFLFSYAAKFLPEYAWYSESLRHGVGDKSLGTFVQILLSFGIFFWSVKNILSKKCATDKYMFYTLCSYFYFISQLFTLNMIVMNRIGYYFLPFCFILCANNVQNVNNEKTKIFLKTGICSMMILYFIYITVYWAAISYGTVPYELFK